MSNLTVRRDASGRSWLVEGDLPGGRPSVHSDEGMGKILDVIFGAAKEIEAMSLGTPIARAVNEIAEDLSIQMNRVEDGTDDEIEKAVTAQAIPVTANLAQDMWNQRAAQSRIHGAIDETWASRIGRNVRAGQ